MTVLIVTELLTLVGPMLKIILASNPKALANISGVITTVITDLQAIEAAIQTPTSN